MSENFPEKETSPDLANLPGELGFIETEELKQTRERLLRTFAVGDPENQIPYLSDLYQAAGQEVLEKIEGKYSERYIKGQIGFIVARANIYFDAGQFGLYRTELKDALTYAENMNYDDIATQIESALDNVPQTEEEQLTADVTSSELALALADILPEEELRAIAGMGLDNAIGHAFTELPNYGIDDPEAFLKEKGILE